MLPSVATPGVLREGSVSGNTLPTLARHTPVSPHAAPDVPGRHTESARYAAPVRAVRRDQPVTDTTVRPTTVAPL
ncbi:MAG TPA: hypothetical protein PKA99_02570 [Dermatophilaceae bacterium]|nr:hypothetical protein [Dermatophilaceae bacterium]